MKFFRTSLSLVLLVAVALLVVPKELLHEFTAHQDTKDVTCNDFCAHHFSNEHQHCEALQLSTPPFHQPLNNFSFISFKLFSVTCFESTSHYLHSSSAFLFFRGPPLA